MPEKTLPHSSKLQSYDFSWVKRPSYDGLTQEDIDGPVNELKEGLTQSGIAAGFIEETEFAGLESLIGAIHDKYGDMPLLNLKPETKPSSPGNLRYNAEAFNFFNHHGVMSLIKYKPGEAERRILLGVNTYKTDPRTNQPTPTTSLEMEDLLQNVLIPYFQQHLIPVGGGEIITPSDLEVILFSPPVFNYMLNIIHGPNAKDMCRQLLKDFNEEESALKAYYAMLKGAIERTATDIHIEPGGESDDDGKPRIRYRIDGALAEVKSKLPRRVLAGLINVIKTNAQLNISEKRLPQDGSILFGEKARELEVVEGITPEGKRKINDPELTDYIVQQERLLAGYSLRVSVIPVLHGEKAVLRILPRSRNYSLNKLGYRESDLVRLRKGLDVPNGLFLVTGPTGSGKTTTLYAAISELNKPDVNISTVEDPIEIPQIGINQTQVRSEIGLTFAELLRRLLRQDPDILLVGEIRDSETANVAVQASETGHLVFSTLHTNNATSVVSRFLDLGVQGTQLQDSLRCVAAQRLIRKVCSNCRQEYNATPALREIFGQDFINHDVILYTQNENPKNCGVCHGLGFHGRAPITEIWLPGEGERELMFEGIRNNKKYAEVAIRNGMNPLAVSAFERLLNHETSLTFVKEFVSEEDMLASRVAIQDMVLRHRVKQ